ncbi:DeoR/GlpR transcriptional regulator [Siculibacillus lacustris]|uniref:DeoR/GlpR transcriptional regulator n=1 Tax=Siculibacillus lacustris TaxID=1549641 RepID=A0A4Q9VY09_9HYPH|nr:DeoR/GlpR family DNA-binding transcription regulator [Siculibacillus lacustris]TBW41387.1 DeoR/GlpR transcriptional regulator [Siculibacillus lacustris]
MHQIERRQAILRALTETRVVTVAALTRSTGASEATIRRDISDMSDARLLRKVHGGAERLDDATPDRLSTRGWAATSAIAAAQKRAIAREAAALCNDHETVMIGGGTTTRGMVEYLIGRPVNVLTNSLAVALPLIAEGDGRVILAGGEVYREHNLVLSPFEHDSLDNFLAQKVFIGAMGVGAFGAMDGDPLLVRASQKMMRRAAEVVLLVDSSKFRLHGGMIMCPLNRVNRVVTDDGVDERTVAMLTQAGVAVTVVETAGTRPPVQWRAADTPAVDDRERAEGARIGGGRGGDAVAFAFDG